jgi:peroxiredoxin
VPSNPLQAELDAITAHTRALVQPERLAVTDAAVQDLLATGIESRILPIGSPAPEFALPDTHGKLVRSTDLLALGPVILNFFRGRWCPYCMTELEAWQAAYENLRKNRDMENCARGALVVAISPQLPRQNDFTAQQHSITFPILSDPTCDLAAQFGIAYTVPEPMRQHFRSILVNIPFVNGNDTWRLPLPATFVLTPKQQEDGAVSGTVLFAEAHADHRVRPDPTDVLAAL